MSDSLLSELSGLLSPDLVSNLAGNVGESSGSVSKGLSAVFPALLGGVATKADEPGFMSSLVGMVNDSSIDESVLDRPQSLLGSAAKSLPAMLAGGKLLGSVFGNNIDGLVGKVAGFAGINPSTASSLFKFGAPLALSMFRKKVKRGGLDAAGLGNLLRREKDTYQAALPSGVRLGDYVDAPATARAAVQPAPVEKKSIWRYVIPLLLVLAAFWLLSQFMGREDDARVTEPATTTTTSTPATAVVQFASDDADLPMNAGDSLGTVSRYLAANPGARATVTAYLIQERRFERRFERRCDGRACARRGRTRSIDPGGRQFRPDRRCRTGLDHWHGYGR